MSFGFVIKHIYDELSALFFTKTVAIWVVSIVAAIYAIKFAFKIRRYFKYKTYPRDVVIVHQVIS